MAKVNRARLESDLPHCPLGQAAAGHLREVEEQSFAPMARRLLAVRLDPAKRDLLSGLTAALEPELQRKHVEWKWVEIPVHRYLAHKPKVVHSLPRGQS
eukprot:2994890-Prymnesium_polylepis.2